MKKNLMPLFFLIIITFPGLSQPLSVLPLNEIKPSGWIKNQVLRDISSGYISVYDELQPNLDIEAFGPDKIHTIMKDSTRTWIPGGESWWSSCHLAYFSEGLVRNAFYSGYKPARKKIDSIINFVVGHQEPDGYMGIYDEDFRLDKQPTGNAELLVHSLMYMAILAYYEFTGDEKYLNAVKKAVDYTISRFESSGKSYFGHENPRGGGLSHGLIFEDVLEWLCRITGDERYVSFGFWLYEDFSNSTKTLTHVDNALGNLLDEDRLFMEHAVHVVEHFRTPFWLSSHTDDPRYQEAVNNIFRKLEIQTTPTEALVNDTKIRERVVGNYGSSYLPYEYCTITELAFSYASAYQKFNNPELGDKIETLVFNAGQGARFPDGKANRYSTIDNQLTSTNEENFRDQYAACHRVACCNLQGAKLMPYYISHMWMKNESENSIYAVLHGPSELNTTINGKEVRIKSVTNYPFENTITFQVFTEEPVEFSLFIRNPEWSGDTRISAENAVVTREGGYHKITGVWLNQNLVKVEFNSPVEVKRFLNNEFYLKRGALIYAMKIDEERTITKEFKQGLANYDIVPGDKNEAELIFHQLKIEDNADLRFEDNKEMFIYRPNDKASTDYPFDRPYGFIEGNFYHDGKMEKRKLVPLGSTILRKVTFKEKSM